MVRGEFQICTCSGQNKSEPALAAEDQHVAEDLTITDVSIHGQWTNNLGASSRSLSTLLVETVGVHIKKCSLKK